MKKIRLLWIIVCASSVVRISLAQEVVSNKTKKIIETVEIISSSNPSEADITTCETFLWSIDNRSLAPLDSCIPSDLDAYVKALKSLTNALRHPTVFVHFKTTFLNAWENPLQDSLETETRRSELIRTLTATSCTLTNKAAHIKEKKLNYDEHWLDPLLDKILDQEQSGVTSSKIPTIIKRLGPHGRVLKKQLVDEGFWPESTPTPTPASTPSATITRTNTPMPQTTTQTPLENATMKLYLKPYISTESSLVNEFSKRARIRVSVRVKSKDSGKEQTLWSESICQTNKISVSIVAKKDDDIYIEAYRDWKNYSPEKDDISRIKLTNTKTPVIMKVSANFSMKIVAKRIKKR